MSNVSVLIKDKALKYWADNVYLTFGYTVSVTWIVILFFSIRDSSPKKYKFCQHLVAFNLFQICIHFHVPMNSKQRKIFLRMLIMGWDDRRCHHTSPMMMLSQHRDSNKCFTFVTCCSVRQITL